MLPDLDSLALFVKAAETRNLTRAAESSFITVPAASRRLSLLEHQFKAQLFELAQARGWQRFCETQGIADAQAPQPDVPGWMQWLPWPVLTTLKTPR